MMPYPIHRNSTQNSLKVSSPLSLLHHVFLLVTRTFRQTLTYIFNHVFYIYRNDVSKGDTSNKRITSKIYLTFLPLKWIIYEIQFSAVLINELVCRLFIDK